MGIPKTKYKIITTPKEIDKLISCCQHTKYASFDYETTGTRIYNKDFYPTILGISYEPGSSIIVPLGHFDSPFKKGYKGVIKDIGEGIISEPKITKIGWNVKYDLQVMRKYGVQEKGVILDGMLAKYLLDEVRPHGLKDAVRRFLPQFGDYEEDYEGCKLPWAERPLEGLSQYCAIDTDMTFRLMLFFEKKLIDLGMYSLYRNLIMMASKVLTDVEIMGQKLDTPFHDSLKIKYEKLIAEEELKARSNKRVKRFEKELVEIRIDKLISKVESEIEELENNLNNTSEQKKINSLNKSISNREEKIAKLQARAFTTKNDLKILEPINFGSSQQMTQLLFTGEKGFKFDVVKFTKKDKRDTDNPSASEEVLLELQKIDKSGFIDSLLELRGLKQINNMFVKGFTNLVQDDGRLHPKFHIQGCITQENMLVCSERDVRIGDITPKEVGTEDISHLGLRVLTHDGTFQNITHGINKGMCETWKVSDDRGNELNCTPKHKLLTPQGMRTVENIIHRGLTVIMCDTRYLSFETTKRVEPPKEVIFKPLWGIKNYVASSEGNIYSLNVVGSQGKQIGPPVEKSIRINKGYRRVWLGVQEGRKKPYKVSHLVWEAFNEKTIPPGYVIDHIDTCKLNDTITNLQILTKSENVKKAYTQTRTAYTKGGINGMSILNTKTVGKILYGLSKGKTESSLALKYGCSTKQVNRLAKRECWDHIYLTKITLIKNLGLQLIVDLTVEKNHSYVLRNNYINKNTVSGRLSSSEPNAQQYPRTASNPDIRKCLIPTKGKLYLMMDYSQAELRVMAHLSKCKGLLEAFAKGWDPHLSVACKKYGKKYEDIYPIYKDEQHPEYKTWKVRRKQAKHIVFGCIYCIGAEKLASELSTPTERVSAQEAKLFLDDFFKDFPEVKKFMNKQMKFMHKHGYVKTLFGRKRRCPEIFGDNKMQIVEAEHASVNMPCLLPISQALCKTKGWVNYEQLVIGDEILALDPLNGTTQWEGVDDLTIYDFNGNMVRMKSKHVDIQSTPNHRWYAMKGTKHKLGDLVNHRKVQDELILNHNKLKEDIKGLTKQGLNLFQVSKQLNISYKKVRDVHLKNRGVLTHPLINPLVVKTSKELMDSSQTYSIPIKAPHMTNNENELSDNYIAFLGWYLTDGSIRHKRVKLMQSSSANPKKVGIIDSIMEAMGIPYTRKPHASSDLIYWGITDTNFIEKLESLVPNRELNMSFLSQLNNTQLSILLENMRLGDGYKTITSGNKVQAELIQALIVLCGGTSSMSLKSFKGKRAYFKGRKPSKKGQLYIEATKDSWGIKLSNNRESIHTKNSYKEENNFSLVPYNGVVWCPKVKSGAFITRTLGEGGIYRTLVTGNCQGAASDMALFASILIWQKVKSGELPNLVEVGTVHDSIYFEVDPKDINPKTIYQLWSIAKNPDTKKWFNFAINDVEMSMDFEIGTSQGQELPFAIGYDYQKLLDGNFDENEYFSYVNKCKSIDIRDYPKVYPSYFK